jgi:hypothetical protein
MLSTTERAIDRRQGARIRAELLFLRLLLLKFAKNIRRHCACSPKTPIEISNFAPENIPTRR